MKDSTVLDNNFTNKDDLNNKYLFLKGELMKNGKEQNPDKSPKNK